MEVTGFCQLIDFITPPTRLSVAATFDNETPKENKKDHTCFTTRACCAAKVSVHTADLPIEVLKADSVLGACVSTAHFDDELGVKQQHKVDAATVLVHIHQE